MVGASGPLSELFWPRSLTNRNRRRFHFFGQTPSDLWRRMRSRPAPMAAAGGIGAEGDEHRRGSWEQTPGRGPTATRRRAAPAYFWKSGLRPDSDLVRTPLAGVELHAVDPAPSGVQSISDPSGSLFGGALTRQRPVLQWHGVPVPSWTTIRMFAPKRPHGRRSQSDLDIKGLHAYLKACRTGSSRRCRTLRFICAMRECMAFPARAGSKPYLSQAPYHDRARAVSLFLH